MKSSGGKESIPVGSVDNPEAVTERREDDFSGRRKVAPEDSAVVMFSGGLDSTVSAIQLCERFRRVVLLTVDVPYTVNLRFCTRNLARLRAAFPGVRIEHHMVDGRTVRDQIWDDFCNDYFDYCRGRGIAITCLGCKIAMMVIAIREGLREGIGHLSNGITRSQIAHPHSDPRMVNRFGDFIAEYNMVFVNDVYEIETRERELAILDRHGLGQGISIGASSVTHQPRCFVGPPTKMWLEAAPVDSRDMLDYFDSKLPLMRDILAPDAHLKGGIRGRPELRTRVDESLSGEHTHEFGPAIDRAIGLASSPLWWATRALFRARRRRR
jgi:hypothetical protein